MAQSELSALEGSVRLLGLASGSLGIDSQSRARGRWNAALTFNPNNKEKGQLKSMAAEITSRQFGPEHRLYTLTNGDLQVQVTNYGATLVSVHTPDTEGNLANIILGFDNIDGYLGNHPYFGSIVGPCANRIGHASFVLDCTEYKIEPNDGPHLLHSGKEGFSRKTWHAERRGGSEPHLLLSLETKPGEGGFPGSMSVCVKYTLRENELEITYQAETRGPTVCSLTSHPYWNLHGAGQGDILDHLLEVFADCYTPTDELLIPTGQVLGVHDTALDFTRPKLIRVNMFAREAIPGGGYDHNLVLRGGVDGAIAKAAVLSDRSNGRKMEIWTTQPALQLYTGHGLDGSLRGAAGPFVKYGGVCLEAQHYPDAVNHEHFPSAILRPGDDYLHTTIHKFSVVR